MMINFKLFALCVCIVLYSSQVYSQEINDSEIDNEMGNDLPKVELDGPKPTPVEETTEPRTEEPTTEATTEPSNSENYTPFRPQFIPIPTNNRFPSTFGRNGPRSGFPNSRPFGQPFGGQPFGGQPSSDNPFGSQPFGGQSSSDHPFGGQPFGGQPSSDHPFGGQPFGGQPSGGQPFGGQPRNRPSYDGMDSGEHSNEERSYSNERPRILILTIHDPLANYTRAQRYRQYLQDKILADLRKLERLINEEIEEMKKESNATNEVEKIENFVSSSKQFCQVMEDNAIFNYSQIMGPFMKPSSAQIEIRGRSFKRRRNAGPRYQTIVV